MKTGYDQKLYWGKAEVAEHAEAVAMWEAMTVDLPGGNFNWDAYHSECSCDDNEVCEICIEAAIADQHFVAVSKCSEWAHYIKPEYTDGYYDDMEQIWNAAYEATLPKAIRMAALVYG